jgi:hypothetical protein
MMTTTDVNTQRSANWRRAVRAIWIVLAVGYLALWLASLPEYYTRVSTLSIEPFRLGERVIVDNASALLEANQRGLSLPTSAVYSIGLNLFQILVYYGVSAVILWRAQNGFGLFTAFVLLVFSFTNMENTIGVAAPFPGSLLLIEIPTYIIWPLWVLWLALFPTGRIVPRRARIPFALGIAGFMALQAASVLAVFGILPPQIDTLAASSWGAVIALPTFGFVLFSQVYRYLRVSTVVERQQTKWFLLGVVVFFAGIAAFAMFPDLFKTSFLMQNFFSVAFLLFPVSIALAILRYRLWDIDILIRRTITYSILTALLALIYFGGVILMQQLTRSITGASSDMAIVVSTLVIAALFFPLRRRVQNAIDRRFYRRKYDAAKTLAAFGATVRDEVELEKLTAELLNVVNETMQPMSVSLWLKPTAEKQTRTRG